MYFAMKIKLLYCYNRFAEVQFAFGGAYVDFQRHINFHF